MEVLFTAFDSRHFPEDLRIAYDDLVGHYCRLAMTFYGGSDPRTLVIVQTCPHCAPDRKMDINGVVLVSPFRGIDPLHYKGIETPEKYPPFRNPGVGEEAATRDEYLTLFRQAIDRALA